MVRIGKTNDMSTPASRECTSRSPHRPPPADTPCPGCTCALYAGRQHLPKRPGARTGGRYAAPLGLDTRCRTGKGTISGVRRWGDDGHPSRFPGMFEIFSLWERLCEDVTREEDESLQRGILGGSPHLSLHR